MNCTADALSRAPVGDPVHLEILGLGEALIEDLTKWEESVRVMEYMHQEECTPEEEAEAEEWEEAI